MQKRFDFHFEPNKGWMNDPNGLIYYKGYYHAFFQYNPKAPKWDTMHWGHAVSKDLIHWEQCDIALFPDMDYEDDGGCFSGSAIEKDGRLYLFYTSVSHAMGQTQSVAYSDDGFHFVKYEGNPVIRNYPEDGSKEFRDPKVIKYGREYIMVTGSCHNYCGRVLMYKSDDLFNWDYAGVLYEAKEYSDAIECPDFFPLGDKYVLMYSRMSSRFCASQFVIGDFDGKNFIPEHYSIPEIGPQFYAPQTFWAPDGRRIMIGWFYDWKMKPEEGLEYAGALSLPRELELSGKNILVKPVREAAYLSTSTDENVIIDSEKVTVTSTSEGDIEYYGDIRRVEIYRDGKAVEVFINEGEKSVSAWVK